MRPLLILVLLLAVASAQGVPPASEFSPTNTAAMETMAMRINTLGGLVSTLNERNKRLEHQVNVLFALFVVCGLGFCAALSRKVSKPDAALVDSPKEAPHDSGS